MTEEKKGLRMYIFVPYNILDIQKGIQAGHCAEQYALKYNRSIEWNDYVANHKTWIILNGGTTNHISTVDMDVRGSLDIIGDKLDLFQIPHAKFYEPDLNNALTAVCFIANEKVWDFENYPMYEEWSILTENISLARIDPDKSLKKYRDFIGGAKNHKIKELIYNKPLA